MNILDIVRGYILQARPDLAQPAAIDERPLPDLINSIEMVDLLFFLEERFRIKIEDGEVVSSNFQTLAAVAAFIERKVAQGA